MAQEVAKPRARPSRSCDHADIAPGGSPAQRATTAMQSGPSAHIHHCRPLPFHFCGRAPELAQLERALEGTDVSLVAFVGPGGQGKTALVQHWLGGLRSIGPAAPDVVLWSFYRGKDADLC